MLALTTAGAPGPGGRGARVFNNEWARLMAPMVEVGLCGAGPADESLAWRYLMNSAQEIHALLLTRRAADAQFWLACDLRWIAQGLDDC